MLFAISIFVIAGLAFGRDVTPDMALKVGKTKLEVQKEVWRQKGLIGKGDFSIKSSQKLVSENGKVLAYVLDLEPNGFIVISSDTDIKPIIAYSFKSDFIVDDNCGNALYHMVLKDMKLRREAISLYSKEKKGKNNVKWEKYIAGDLDYFRSLLFQQWPPEGSTSTGGWMETAWHQRSPYNNFCPLDPNTGNRSVVGCVGTAMAQIVNYHRYIGDLSFSEDDEYTSNGIGIDADSSAYDFPSFERLNAYLDSLRYRYQHDISINNNDIAALNFACGISVQMSYSARASGADVYSIADALIQKFNYFSAITKWSEENDFYSVLKSNMMNALPAELSIDKTYT